MEIALSGGVGGWIYILLGLITLADGIRIQCANES